MDPFLRAEWPRAPLQQGREKPTERGAELRAGEGLGWSRGKAGGKTGRGGKAGAPAISRAGLPSHMLPFVA